MRVQAHVERYTFTQTHTHVNKYKSYKVADTELSQAEDAKKKIKYSVVCLITFWDRRRWKIGEIQIKNIASYCFISANSS